MRKDKPITSYRLILTDTAKADLKSIRDYISKDSPAAAKSFVGDLVAKLFSLAELGATGSPRDWVSSGLRAFPYRERCFYFRVVEGKLYVVRILHGKQDVTSQTFPEV